MISCKPRGCVLEYGVYFNGILQLSDFAGEVMDPLLGSPVVTHQPWTNTLPTSYSAWICRCDPDPRKQRRDHAWRRSPRLACPRVSEPSHGKNVQPDPSRVIELRVKCRWYIIYFHGSKKRFHGDVNSLIPQVQHVASGCWEETFSQRLDAEFEICVPQ
jgi:hypothetical protein